MKLSKKVEKAFIKHVLAKYPEEAGGVVADKEFIPLENQSTDPENHYSVDAKTYGELKVTKNVTAFLHSHPYKLDKVLPYPAHWPSNFDMQQWLYAENCEIPWGIIGTDGEGVTEFAWLDEQNPEPLVGRIFLHGVNDCYSAVRDWYKERGITLKNYPREYGWWEDRTNNYYMDNFTDAGFYEVLNIDDVQIGDVLLFRVGRVISHAAVVTGNNQMLHHQFHELSRHESIAPDWSRHITKVLRYKDFK